MRAAARAAGVDVGGTFTDIVAVLADGSVRARKVPTTPDDQSRGVADALATGSDAAGAEAVAHGTTTATNAVLERDVARVALVVTAGFADVLTIARQDRPSLYDLSVVRPAPLVVDGDVVEAAERIGADGAIVTPLDDDEVDRVAAAVAETAPEAVAVSLLFGYAAQAHERRLVAALRERLGAAVPVTAATELLPELREYERTSTCVLNAAVAPVMRRYLSRLADRVAPASVSVMTSGGGTAGLDAAADAPVHTLLSGPAAGVVAAAAVAAQAGYADALAFDMGGTSTDVCLVRDGEPQRHTGGEIGGWPFRTPAVGIHTVGAGGGSLAWVDAGGALRVGPRSAGAVPGPACYGRGGTEPTVTDAHAVLGHLSGSAEFGSGALTLDVAAGEEALARLPASVAGEAGPAAGVLTVVRATMARALRRVSTEQGVDPAGLALVAYGGAGPLHACALARELGCPAVVIPPAPGVLSALGLLLAPPRAETSLTVMATLPAASADAGADQRGASGGVASGAAGPATPRGGADLAAVWADLAEQASAALAAQGVTHASVTRLADLRYAGQSHELRVPVRATDAAALREGLHRAHHDAYGYRLDDADVEAVTLRAVATGEPVLTDPPGGWDLGAHRGADNGEATIGLADGRWVPARLVDRAALPAGGEVRGPALVGQPDATTLLEPDDVGRVDDAGNLVVEVGRDHG